MRRSIDRNCIEKSVFLITDLRFFSFPVKMTEEGWGDGGLTFSGFCGQLIFRHRSSSFLSDFSYTPSSSAAFLRIVRTYSTHVLYEPNQPTDKSKKGGGEGEIELCKKRGRAFPLFSFSFSFLLMSPKSVPLLFCGCAAGMNLSTFSFFPVLTEKVQKREGKFPIYFQYHFMKKAELEGFSFFR